jgi:vacuolar protein sorting-associated protein 13A/C
LGYGGYAILKGAFDGVTGIFTEPVKGGMQDGAGGVIKGLGRGLIGVVAKPIGGVAGFV